MKTIFKYQLLPDKREYLLPKGAEVLSVGEQAEDLFMWVKIPVRGEEREVIYIEVYGAGHGIPDDQRLKFINTVWMTNGLVFHVFQNLA